MKVLSRVFRGQLCASGAGGERLVSIMYPFVADGIANGLFMPNRASILCGYCPYRSERADEYGSTFEQWR